MFALFAVCRPHFKEQEFLERVLKFNLISQLG